MTQTKNVEQGDTITRIRIQSSFLFLATGLLFLFSQLTYARDLNSKAEAEKLLSDNTVEMQDMRLKKSATWYFKKDGQLKNAINMATVVKKNGTSIRRAGYV